MTERRKPKDIWDKLGALSTAFSALIVGGVGAYYKYSLNRQADQRNALQADRDLQLRRVEIVEKFIPHLMNDGPSRRAALIAIHGLGDTQLALDLSNLFGGDASTEALGQVAARTSDPKTQAVTEEAYSRAVGAAPPRSTTKAASAVGKAAILVALTELSAGAREEPPGSNAGPWVRKYMHGQEGVGWAVGFVSWCFQQALPTFPYDVSADGLAKKAKARSWFVGSGDPTTVAPGDIYLLSSGNRYRHAGIVTAVEPGFFTGVEGNTNRGDSREGFLVAQRPRKYVGVDFVRVPDALASGQRSTLGARE